MHHVMLRCVAISVLVASHAPDAGAQQGNREVVRGRVVDDSAKAVVAATVTVTRGPDRLVQTTTTDSAGNYRVRFEEGTGDYLVSVSSPGLRPARRRRQMAGPPWEELARTGDSPGLACPSP